MIIRKCNGNSVKNVFSTLFYFIKSKLLFPKSTLIKSPFYIRVKGSMDGLRNAITGPGLIIDVLDQKAHLVIGDRLRAYHSVHIGCMQSVIIGNDVLMASGVYISDHSHGSYTGDNQSPPTIPPNKRPIVCKPVVIGDNCWLGEHVCVLPGVTIGSGTIVGANAVVTTDLPPNVIAAGIPAKPIKYWDETLEQWVPTSRNH